MADRSRVCGLWRVLRIIIVCGMTAIEIGEGALRARGRHVDRGRALAAVKAAMNGSAGTLLAADQNASATSQPVAVGAQRWGRRFFPTSASTAQTTHEGPWYA